MEKITDLLDTKHHINPLQNPLQNLAQKELSYSEGERSIWFYWPIKHIIFELPKSSTPPPVPTLHLFEQRLCIKIIQWEIWGITTQLPFLERKKIFQHLENLEILIRPRLSQENQATFTQLLSDFKRTLK